MNNEIIYETKKVIKNANARTRIRRCPAKHEEHSPLFPLEFSAIQHCFQFLMDPKNLIMRLLNQLADILH